MKYLVALVLLLMGGWGLARLTGMGVSSNWNEKEVTEAVMKKTPLVSVETAQVNLEYQELFNHAKEVLKKGSMFYVDNEEFSVEAEYSVFYNSREFTKPAETGFGKMIRKGGNFYREQMGDITILNEAYEFQLDATIKTISLLDRGEKKLIPDNFEGPESWENIDSVFTIDGGYGYLISNNPVYRVDLILSKDGQPQIVRNYFRNQMDFGEGDVRVISQVRYFNHRDKPEITKDVFSLSNYIKITDDKEVSLKKNYEEYHLYSNLK